MDDKMKNQVDPEKVENFLFDNQKKFAAARMDELREKLLELDKTTFANIASKDFKDPTQMLLLAFFLGGWGLDRFLLKDYGIGVIKLVTGGACGIWTIIDCFSIRERTQEYNYKDIMSKL